MLGGDWEVETPNASPSYQKRLAAKNAEFTLSGGSMRTTMGVEQHPGINRYRRHGGSFALGILSLVLLRAAARSLRGIIPLTAIIVIGCERSQIPTQPKKSVHDPALAIEGLSANHVRPPIPVVPVVPPIEERFAKLVPEFAGAYRGDGHSLIVRVSDINFSRTGSAAIARALLENELKASGRGELTVTFDRARYDYSQLRTWLALCLDSLGTYKAVSWSIYQRTSQIRVAFANESALSGFKSVVANLGIPSDAVLLGLEPEEQLYQARLDTVVRPVRGGLVVYTHQWYYDGAGTAWNGPCTLTGIFFQGTWPEFLTAAHCVNFAAHGGDLDWMVYQNIATGDGFCSDSRQCVGSIDGNPPFSGSIPGCPSGSYCRNSDAASGSPSGLGVHGLTGTVALPLAGPVAPPLYSASLSIDTANISLQGAYTNIMIGDTLSKIGEATGWTKGVVFDVDVASVVGGLTKLHSVRVQAGGGPGDSGAPVLWQQSDGYYLAGLLFGGGNTVDGTRFFSMSQWTYIASDLGFTSVK